MKDKIIARDKEHLKELIDIEVGLNGFNCDLNHIDVSNVKDMSYIFFKSKFNGDISQWNVSNVINMGFMFYDSKFNGDLSKWDVSKVKYMSRIFFQSKFNKDISEWNVSNVLDMEGMFQHSQFKGDVSKWDVSKVEDMAHMFRGSSFNGDVSGWKPYSLKKLKDFEDILDMFLDCQAPIPYWANIEDLEKRRMAIDNYHLGIQLNAELNSNNSSGKKPKI